MKRGLHSQDSEVFHHCEVTHTRNYTYLVVNIVLIYISAIFLSNN
jgi:hypothetical protein